MNCITFTFIFPSPQPTSVIVVDESNQHDKKVHRHLASNFHQVDLVSVKVFLKHWDFQIEIPIDNSIRDQNEGDLIHFFQHMLKNNFASTGVVTCESCGTVWDGNAQCPCWKEPYSLREMNYCPGDCQTQFSSIRAFFEHYKNSHLNGIFSLYTECDFSNSFKISNVNTDGLTDAEVKLQEQEQLLGEARAKIKAQDEYIQSLTKAGQPEPLPVRLELAAQKMELTEWLTNVSSGLNNIKNTMSDWTDVTNRVSVELGSMEDAVAEYRTSLVQIGPIIEDMDD